MKNLIVTLIFTSLCFLSFNFADAYSEFGAGSREVEESLFTVLHSPRLYLPYINNTVKSACRSISEENKAVAIQKIGGLFKAYFASGHFKARYDKWVAATFPQTSEAISEKRKAEIRDGRSKEIENYTAAELSPTVDLQIQMGETYAGMEKMLATLPAGQRAELDKQIRDGKKNIVFFKNLKPLLKSDLPEAKRQYAAYLADDQIAQEEAVLIERSKSNASEYDKWKDPEKVIKLKLNEFMEQSKDVDFAAQTSLTDNRKKFVNSVYERKSTIWKFCYRMGKTPTATARTFAQNWLSELK